MTVNVSIFYKILGMTSSKLYWSNKKDQFCIHSVLFPVRFILHLRKNSKCNTKGAYFSVQNESKYVNIVSKFRINPIKSLLE